MKLQQQTLAVVEAYLDAVSRRGREPMPPADFHPDWDDQPSRHTVFLDADRIVLPVRPPTDRSDVSTATAFAEGRVYGAPWDLTSLAWTLRNVYAPQDRRLRITWNQDTRIRELYPEAIWGRGSASGGGMYPTEAYLVTDGGFGRLDPGVYHYSTAHHALEPIVFGSDSSTVAGAVGSDAGTFLVLSTRFWKNAFKYNSFAYHVVTQDVGAFLYSAQLLAASIGRRLRPELRFVDADVNAVLRLDEMEETVLAIAPLAPALDVRRNVTSRSAAVTRFERSQRVFGFDAVTEVHRAVLATSGGEDERDSVPADERPSATAEDPSVAASATDAVILLPTAARNVEEGVAGLIRKRHSSFGAFSSTEPLSLDEMRAILDRGAAAAEAALESNAAGRTSLTLFSTRVTGLTPGAYRFETAPARLHEIVSDERMDRFLQRNYFLSNYNLDTAAAVIAIGFDWNGIRGRRGARGYREVNAAAAAAGQAINIAATAIGLASGIVLGFDNVSFDELIGDRTRTFLFVIIGRNRDDGAQYRYEIE